MKHGTIVIIRGMLDVALMSLGGLDLMSQLVVRALVQVIATSLLCRPSRGVDLLRFARYHLGMSLPHTRPKYLCANFTHQQAPCGFPLRHLCFDLGTFLRTDSPWGRTARKSKKRIL